MQLILPLAHNGVHNHQQLNLPWSQRTAQGEDEWHLHTRVTGTGAHENKLNVFILLTHGCQARTCHLPGFFPTFWGKLSTAPHPLSFSWQLSHPYTGDKPPNT